MLSAGGLIAALLDDGVGDTLSWLVNAAPLLIVFLYVVSDKH